MEWAYADVFVDPAFFERQELLNDQCDIRLVLEFLDDFVGVERHAPNVEILGEWGRHCMPLGALRFGLWGRFVRTVFALDSFFL